MKKNGKEALVKLFGAIGLIVAIVGIFTDLYSTINGFVAAVIIWILTGVLSSYLGVEKKPSKDFPFISSGICF